MLFSARISCAASLSHPVTHLPLECVLTGHRQDPMERPSNIFEWGLDNYDLLTIPPALIRQFPNSSGNPECTASILFCETDVNELSKQLWQ